MTDDYFDNEEAIAKLITSNNVIMLNIKTEDGRTMGLFVNCSDTFAWGCADCEPFVEDDIEQLYKYYTENEIWGTTKWCCIHRNQKPQKPVENRMKELGVWDELMEALPSNTQDKEIHDMIASLHSREIK